MYLVIWLYWRENVANTKLNKGPFYRMGQKQDANGYII
jgi:hypothetical protein